eukprot:6210154-Pleurochrysis_carterae.AAC.3
MVQHGSTEAEAGVQNSAIEAGEASGRSEAASRERRSGETGCDERGISAREEKERCTEWPFDSCACRRRSAH